MGFFDYLQSNGSTPIKSQSLNVRKEVVQQKRPFHTSAVQAKSRTASPIRRGKGITSSKSQLPGVQPVKTQQARRKRLTPAVCGLTSSSDESEGESKSAPSKRQKAGDIGASIDRNRRLRSEVAFSNADEGVFEFVHAANIASTRQPSQYMPAFQWPPDDLQVSVQYPSLSQRERYELVEPRDKDDFNPVKDILEVTQLVANHYLTEEQSDKFLNETSGIQRKLKRAVARRSCKELRDGIEEYNDVIKTSLDEGTIAQNLDNIHKLQLPLVEHILTQIYARTVSLKVDSLRKYENGTDNVYGELLPRFISQIFHDVNLTSSQVFVDLGSGVANVVLQAALEIGCESWGCEVMDNACDLAELQEKEFKARCRLWGLAPGKTHLERGDFLTNSNTGKVLKRADVVLVNNQAFTPALNDSLVNLFLDLKEGCYIVSLKSFVPADHKISARNLNSPINLLEVETKPYYSNCVSWTNAPGTYCVARKDSRRLQEFSRKLK